MRDEGLTPWRTHDWKVRTIESIAPGGGSRLAFTCRSCGRIFNQTTINSRTWAVDGGGTALTDTVTNRWLAESCLRRPADGDEVDRKQFKNTSTLQS
jgi:hypothetical protein